MQRHLLSLATLFLAALFSLSGCDRHDPKIVYSSKKKENDSVSKTVPKEIDRVKQANSSRPMEETPPEERPRFFR